MKWLALFLLAGSLFAGDNDKLFYSREFPGSTPAYLQVTVTRAGAVEYREAVDDELPVKFKLPAADTEEVFGLAEKLDRFQHPLEAPVKVAFMGTKTFRMEEGDKKTEVKYNYSTDLNAQALQDWFEKMAESAEHRIDVERAAKYDHLGVVKALLLLEGAMDRGRIVAPQQFLPMLDRIVDNENYMHTARARAAEIAESIRKSGDANPK
ncbi:MAG TPA: hypothetical protein VN736_29970 [Candidatus Limnocylindrales bacterium]|nr:hypothetical protein [Candidatus Limnocylindrales bacterium]